MKIRMLRLGMSVRFALVLVAITALMLGWSAHRVHVQRAGIELIRRHGGMYYYDFEYDKANYPPNPRSWAPHWLVTIAGVDLFHHVASVRIEDPNFNDDDLGRLVACLPRIESMGIVGTSITDAGLAHLRGNKRLEGLFMSSNRISDKGIDNLGPETMPVLELIDVRGTAVSAARVRAVEAIFKEREAAARKAHPGARISVHMVLSGWAPPKYLTRDPRGTYEGSIPAAPAEAEMSP